MVFRWTRLVGLWKSIISIRLQPNSNEKSIAIRNCSANGLRKSGVKNKVISMDTEVKSQAKYWITASRWFIDLWLPYGFQCHARYVTVWSISNLMLREIYDQFHTLVSILSFDLYLPRYWKYSTSTNFSPSTVKAYGVILPERRSFVLSVLIFNPTCPAYFTSAKAKQISSRTISILHWIPLAVLLTFLITQSKTSRNKSSTRTQPCSIPERTVKKNYPTFGFLL